MEANGVKIAYKHYQKFEKMNEIVLGLMAILISLAYA